MANTLLKSHGTLLQSDTSFGSYHVARLLFIGSATTAATSTTGNTSWQRYPQIVTVPTLTTCTAAYLTYGRLWGTTVSVMMAALEITFGTMTFNGSTGSFASGSSAPNRQIYGASAATQWASSKPMLYVSTGISATTPTITITYTNQDGTGSRTATITMPTNAAINSAFNLIPFLQSGDTGIQSVQNIATSGGASGAIKVVGLFPLIEDIVSTGTTLAQPVTNPMVMYPLLANDVISFWKGGGSTAVGGFADITLMGDS